MTLLSLQLAAVIVGLVFYLVPELHPRIRELARITFFVGLFAMVVR